LLQVTSLISTTKHPIIDELQEDDEENDNQDFDRHGSQIPAGHCGRLVDYSVT